VTFAVGTGVNLAAFPDASFDYVISYIVFQHIPKTDIIYNYIRESLRVLKPGGRFRFQAKNCAPGLHPDTYSGAAIDLTEVEKIVSGAGRQILSITGEGELFCYVEVGDRAVRGSV
jgi:ubiquinone/menaquinone biosynthesis C-methylase UbiE